MRLNLLFKDLNENVILKENIRCCKLEFGNTNNPKTYADIRRTASNNYKNLAIDDLNEKEDVLKNKLIHIENSDKDNLMIGGLTIFAVIIAIISKIFPDYDKLNRSTSILLTVYFLIMLIFAFILFTLITYSKNIKVINKTFYNLCFEELQKLKKKGFYMVKSSISLEVVADKINLNEKEYGIEVDANIKEYNIKVKMDA